MMSLCLQISGVVVFSFYCQKVFNSFWFIGLLVFTAVLITTVSFSAPVERDLSIKQQGLLQSHLMTAAYHTKLSSRSAPQQ